MSGEWSYFHMWFFITSTEMVLKEDLVVLIKGSFCGLFKDICNSSQ